MSADQRPVDALFAGRREAIDAGRCRRCDEPVAEFRDDVSRAEYRLSGFCQKCQDWFFESDPA